MYNTLKDFQLLIFGIILVLGILCGTKIMSSTLSQSGITVTGSAYEVVKSDSATLKLELSARNENKAAAYAELKKQIPVLKEYLLKNNVKEDEISISAPTNYTSNKYSASGSMTNEIAYYNFEQAVSIKSEDIEKVKKLSIDDASEIFKKYFWN